MGTKETVLLSGTGLSHWRYRLNPQPTHRKSHQAKQLLPLHTKSLVFQGEEELCSRLYPISGSR